MTDKSSTSNGHIGDTDHRHMNGTHKSKRLVDDSEEDDVIRYWVVRCPKNLKIKTEDLDLTFPKKLPSSDRYIDYDDDTNIRVEYQKGKKQLLCINREKKSLGKEDAVEEVFGIATLFLEKNNEQDSDEQIVFSKIWKQPQEMDEIKERNQAFGRIPKKKRKNNE